MALCSALKFRNLDQHVPQAAEAHFKHWHKNKTGELSVFPGPTGQLNTKAVVSKAANCASFVGQLTVQFLHLQLAKLGQGLSKITATAIPWRVSKRGRRGKEKWSIFRNKPLPTLTQTLQGTSLHQVPLQ